IRNVAGISNASAQRAADMKMKCDYLLETYGGRGVTFATGTPISNSISELFIMQTYLQPHELKRRGIDFFDNWAATYAKVVTSLEITPEGTGYRMRSRFAQFHNLPELMAIFRLVADIQTEEMLNLPTPEIEGGKATVIQTECSPFQKEIIQSYVARSEAIRNGSVKPEEDNMLKLTHEARLLAIDPRLLYPDAPNDPNSKLNVCIRNVYDTWRETAENRSTQILFCDSGTPKPGQFNVYDEVKSTLVRMAEVLFETDEDEIAIAEAAKDSLVGKGVPPEEIAFIHDCKTFAQREALFEKVRSGEVRILLGSTSKLGMGTNVQDQLFAIHHIDCPWRPTDITQRNGRGKRYGNKNPVIRICQYVTRGTFDSYLWQIQEQKLRYTSQVMTGKAITRSCEDVDISVLNAAEVKAIATDNPLLLEKMTAENEVTRLTILRKAWQNERMTLKRKCDTKSRSKLLSISYPIHLG
ncbi:MAG: helicase-related protein, partial [Oscillospiraceae bacterium]